MIDIKRHQLTKTWQEVLDNGNEASRMMHQKSCRCSGVQRAHYHIAASIASAYQRKRER